MAFFREEVLNVELARSINEFGLFANPETIVERKLPDVLVVINGIKVNIEGRFINNSASSTLEKDCIQKIEDGIADISVAVFYPNNLREGKDLADLSNKLKKATLNFTVIYPSERNVKLTKFTDGGLADLVEGINNSYNIILKSDILSTKVKEVGDCIEVCSKIASENNLFFSSDKLISELRNVLGIKNGEERDDEKLQLIKISFFILFDALVLHEALSTSLMKVNSLNKKTAKGDYQSFIKKEWEMILTIDFVPIFSIALDILLSLPSSITTASILEKLSLQAISTISSGILLKHDLMGRIYHKLLLKSAGEFYATYYTSIPAAWILSGLSLKSDKKALDTLKEIEEFSIIDPACGSGTLLSSSYNAIKDIYVTSYLEKPNLGELHRILIEKTINGWDILDYAGHLTLTTLAIHNYKTLFEKSNIYVLPVGVSADKSLHLGSLDYIERNLPFLGKSFYGAPTRKDLQKNNKSDVGKTEDYDLVIMNPPFSRSAGSINTKFGYEEEEIKKKLDRHLSDIGNRLNLSGIGQAGLGAYFIILGDKLLKNNSGTLSFVIPRAILSGVSWQKIRELLLKNYEIKYLVNNHDCGSKDDEVEPWSFSENTSLGEVLIVATKTNKPESERYSTIVNLWNKPKNEIESLAVSSLSIKTRNDNIYFLDKETGVEQIKYSEKTTGVVYNIPQKYLSYNFLFPAVFANPELNKLAFNLLFKNIVDTCSIEDLTDSLGIDRKQLTTSLMKVDRKTTHRINLSHPLTLNTLEIKDLNLENVESKDASAESLFEKSSNLLIAEHLFLNNNSVCAVYSDEKILSSAFWEVLVDKDKSKLLTLWLNSTVGFILFLTNVISSYGHQINIKKEQLKQTKVINVNNISESDTKETIKFFDSIKNTEFQKYPTEFVLANKSEGLRRKIDDFFVNKGLVKINLTPYYKLLADEPIISGVRL